MFAPIYGNKLMKIAIIGAGAAGCFCAIQLKRSIPDAEVTLLEAGRKPMAKLAITGGGRCNFTNTFNGINSLSEAYPRGERLMKRLMKSFDQHSICEWFEHEGIAHTVQSDECIFPASQDAMEIVNTFEGLMRRLGVKVLCSSRVTSIRKDGEGFALQLEGGSTVCCNHLIVSAGGLSKASSAKLFDELELEMVPVVPSLFTFNVDDKDFRSLMGTVVKDVIAAIPGTSFRATGPLLITHWGMSGPAALKLSSYAARFLAEKGYRSPVSINWLNINTEEALEWLRSTAASAAMKLVISVYPPALNSHLWKYLVNKALKRTDARWNSLSRKDLNRLAEILTNDPYMMNGKSRFREEFVSCGGIALSNVNLNTLECKKHPGLYFAGEVLDIDAITGGFNLQAAWTTAYTVAQAIASECELIRKD